METKYTFDDILLVPVVADDDIRENPQVARASVFDRELGVPVFSTPMDTITGIQMMSAVSEAGALGVHHRYCDWETLATANTIPGGIAISPSMDIDKITKLANDNCRTFFMMDVAHGNSRKVFDFCDNLIKNGVTKLTSGNVVTCDAVYEYKRLGIQYIRVGMGNGSRCSTRTVTGFGYPQVSALMDIYEEFGHEICIISDGGCKNTGDVIKAFACGAAIVMSGYLFAGCDECPLPGEYRGMASKEALEPRKKDFFVEGESIQVANKGSATNVIKNIQDAIKHACYYGGVTRYRDLVSIDKIIVTQNGFAEGMVRE